MVTVRFFAMLKGLARTETRLYEVEGEVTAGELKKMIADDLPALREVLKSRSVLFSVNQEFATDETVIKDGDEVGLLPPFSGG
jgi:molybdopterin converting factor subunit 1